MANELKFRETMTVEQFKAAQRVDKLQEAPDGSTFFLLHEEGTGGAPVLATF